MWSKSMTSRQTRLKRLNHRPHRQTSLHKKIIHLMQELLEMKNKKTASGSPIFPALCSYAASFPVFGILITTRAQRRHLAKTLATSRRCTVGRPVLARFHWECIRNLARRCWVFFSRCLSSSWLFQWKTVSHKVIS